MLVVSVHCLWQIAIEDFFFLSLLYHSTKIKQSSVLMRKQSNSSQTDNPKCELMTVMQAIHSSFMNVLRTKFNIPSQNARIKRFPFDFGIWMNDWFIDKEKNMIALNSNSKRDRNWARGKNGANGELEAKRFVAWNILPGEVSFDCELMAIVNSEAHCHVIM